MNIEVVKEYYGKVLKSSEDLKTSACCDGGTVPLHLQAALANIHPEVTAKYYGCGITVPAALSASASSIWVRARAATPISSPSWSDLREKSSAST